MMEIMGASIPIALCILSARRPSALGGSLQPQQCFLPSVPLTVLCGDCLRAAQPSLS